MHLTPGVRAWSIEQHINCGVHMKKFTKIVAAATTLLFCAVCASGARAEYPEKPIRLVVPYAPGGAFNLIARALAQRMTKILGQPVVIDNRGGAGGTVGAEIVAKAPADGYTLLMSSSGIQSFQPILYKSLPYDAENDFTQIALFASVPNIVVVANKVPVKTLRELVEDSKTTELFMGSAGTGSVNFMIGELFQFRTGAKFSHVPYKGGGPASVDLAGGQIDLLFVNVPSVLPFIQSGKVRPLALLSAKRHSQLPNIPTAAEAGYRNVDVDSWVGILAPAGTQKSIIEKLSQAVVRAAQDPTLIANFAEQGIVTMPGNSEAYRRLVAEEKARWSELLSKRKVVME